jgi:putative ABC transport system permease protein
MLRSVGMTRGQVAKMILAEAAVMGLIGGAFGLVFGLFLSRTILASMNAMTGYQLTYVVPVQGIWISVLISVMVSQVAAAWPARRAARTRIIQAIQFE